MRKYAIGYLDESSEEIRDFKRFAHKDFDIKDFMPLADPDELIQELLDAHIDALIVDFDLKEENSEIGYFGDEVIERLLTIRYNFPVFIFTNHDEEATDHSKNVDIVIDKSEMKANPQKLLKKIRLKIEKYYNEIKDKENRLLELLNKKQTTTLIPSEEQELIECDDFIEKTLNKRTSIKNDIKGEYSSDVNEMIKLLNKIDETILKIQKPNNE